MHKKQQSLAKAFTLLELSIVLVVISVLTVGVFMGAGLIDSAKLSVARSLTERSVVPQIDGLLAWYETTSLNSLSKSEASDGATVTNWYDIKPDSIPQRKNTLTQGIGAVYYVRDGINNIPALSFSSENDASVSNFKLSAFAQGDSAQHTIFLVFQQKPKTYAGSNVRNIVDSYASINTTIGYADNSGADQIRFYGPYTTAIVFSNPSQVFFNEKSYILGVYRDGAYTKAYFNDTLQNVGGLTINPGSRILSGLTIGSDINDTNSSRFVGLLSEIIIYNRTLKDSERKEVFRYLSKKYNIKVAGI